MNLKESYQAKSPGLSFEQSVKMAKVFLGEHIKEIQNLAYKDIDGWQNDGEGISEEYQQSIKHYLDKVPKEKLNAYLSSGITRGNEVEQVASLLRIIFSGVVDGEFHSIMDGDNFNSKNHFLAPYKNPGIFVLSKKENPEQMTAKDVKIVSDKTVIVLDVHYYPLLEDLEGLKAKKLFPNIKFIKANEIPKYFEGKN